MPRYPLLRARFFVSPDGVCVERASSLTELQKKAIHHRDRFLCQYCGIPVVRGFWSPCG
jgi:hypothetical protein